MWIGVMVRLSTRRVAVFAACAMLGAGCGTTASDPPPRVNRSATPLMGRVADPLQCPDQRPPTRSYLGCDPEYLGGHGLRITRPNGPTPTPALLRPPLPCKPAPVYVCGFATDPPANSYVLSCRDSDNELTGGARVVAPDGSVVAEGACEHGEAIGAWLWWSGGRLVSAASMVDGVRVGLGLYWNDGRYRNVSHDPPAPTRSK